MSVFRKVSTRGVILSHKMRMFKSLLRAQNDLAENGRGTLGLAKKPREDGLLAAVDEADV
jgi:hypothetical protein